MPFAVGASIQVSVRFGNVRQIEFVDFNVPKRVDGDQLLDVPVQVASIRQTHFETVQSSLPFQDARLGAEAVFEEQKLTAGPQHPANFCDSLADILDTAQSEGADDAIEGAVLERKPLAC